MFLGRAFQFLTVLGKKDCRWDSVLEYGTWYMYECSCEFLVACVAVACIMYSCAGRWARSLWILYPFQTDFTRWNPMNYRWFSEKISLVKRRWTPIKFSSDLSDRTPRRWKLFNHEWRQQLPKSSTARSVYMYRQIQIWLLKFILYCQ